MCFLKVLSELKVAIILCFRFIIRQYSETREHQVYTYIKAHKSFVVWWRGLRKASTSYYFDRRRIYSMYISLTLERRLFSAKYLRSISAGAPPSGAPSYPVSTIINYQAAIVHSVSLFMYTISFVLLSASARAEMRPPTPLILPASNVHSYILSGRERERGWLKIYYSIYYQRAGLYHRSFIGKKMRNNEKSRNIIYEDTLLKIFFSFYSYLYERKGSLFFSFFVIIINEKYARVKTIRWGEAVKNNVSTLTFHW